MAIYGHRYTLEFSSEDETTDYRLELHQDGYTYGEEPALMGTDDPVFLSYTPEESGDDPNWLIALSELEVQVIDRAGRLSALSGIEEKEVIAYLYANDILIFEGYVVPGQYVYDRYLDSVATISCVRGESFMRTRLYRSNEGVNFTGIVSPLEVIRNCFVLSGNTGWIVSAMYWLPRLTNNLTSTMDPLRRLRVLQDEFVDEEGNPITCWDVLLIMLRQYQLQLWNDAKSWFVGQRRRVVDTVNNEFEAFIHTDLSTQTPIDLPYALEIWDTDRTTLNGYTISHTRPYKYAGAIYNHLGPEAGVLHFGGFEANGVPDSDILYSALAPPGTTDVWIPSSDSAAIFLASPGAPIPAVDRPGATYTSAKSLKIPTEYAASGYGGPSDFTTVPYVFQETSGFIQGGTDVSLIIKALIKVEWVSNVARNSIVFFSLRAKINDYWLVPGSTDPDDGTQTYYLNDSPTSDEEYLVFEIDPGFVWHELVIKTDPLDDGGTAITGPLYIELLAAIEEQSGLGQLSDNCRWDEVSFQVIDADGNPENQATQSTAVYSDSNNTYGPESAVLLFGDGPTSGHKRRQRIQDGAGSVVDVPGNWQFGRDFGGSASGDYHVGFWAKEWLKQHKIPLLRADLTIKLHGTLANTLPPSTVLRDRRQLKLATNASSGASSIVVIPDPAIDPYKYGVIQTKRPITIDGTEVHTVLFAVLTDEADNEWTLYLDGTLSAGFTTGDSVVQTIDFTWNAWRFSCRRNEVQITAVELLAGSIPDVTCSYDVKPGSLQATSLTDLVGVPCAEEITPVFEPPDAEAGTLFFTTDSTSNNSLIEEKSLVRRNLDGSIQTLYTFTGDEPTALCLDEVERWVFVVQGMKIWRMRYDGSDASMIYEASGFTFIGGIVFIATGTYAGFLVYTAITTPGSTNDDVYRVDRNGNNNTKISNNKYDGGSSLVASSNTEVWCDAGFLGAGIVGYGLAGTSYSVKLSGTTTNNSVGVAIDIVGNRVWYEDSLTIEQSNLSGAAGVAVGGINNGSHIQYDAAGDRIFYGGSGIRYWDGTDLDNEKYLSPLTNGSGESGAYGTNKIVAVQGA